MQDKDALRAVMLERSTQTNEPGRCAALLPVLAGLPEPLALLEVGASAGLCLLPDFYGYDYGRTILAPDTPRSTPPASGILDFSPPAEHDLQCGAPSALP